MKRYTDTDVETYEGGIRKVAAVTIIVLLAAVLVLAALLVKFWNDKRELRAAQEETSAQLELERETAAALQAQQEQLESKLQDMLNIEDAAPVITSDQMKEQLSSIRELVTRQYVYTNAARREGSKTWLWGWDLPFSDTSLLVTYDGVIKAGIDLNEVEIDVNENSRTITVTLPASRVTDNSIPQETINVLEAKDGLFNKITFDEYNVFIGEEKQVMEDKAVEMGLLSDADSEARAIIKAFLELLPGMDAYQLVIQ